MNEKTRSPGSTPPPNYNFPLSDNRPRATRSTHSLSNHSHSSSQLDYAQSGASPRRARSVSTNGSLIRYIPPPSNLMRSDTYKSNTTKGSGGSGRPALYPCESSSTLVGSAFERKVRDEDPISDGPDTSSRLDSLRDLMRSHERDYYVIPSEDYHGSEYIAPHDKRREWISGFTGSVGQAVVSSAYLITDSRYWLQAREQLDHNWVLVEVGNPATGVKDWTQWIIDRAKYPDIGIDARLISYETATALNSALKPKNSKLHYPPQNLVDLVWREKPPRSKELIHCPASGLARLREWVRRQRPTMPSYSKSEPSSIAWMLNLRGEDIPFNPVFHLYLFVGLESAVLFIEEAKLIDKVKGYLTSISVTWRDYNDLSTFLPRKEWGEGNTSYAVCLMMTSFRYAVLPSYVDEMKAVKNDVEINGLRNAYLRDDAAYQGHDITEYEAAWRLTEYRRKNKHYMGLAYETFLRPGLMPVTLPHYVPHKATARMIDRDAPYLNDSSGQYRDGTCDTTRIVHFGRPTPEQCEAFTRVLRGHIAIDSAIFPEGTSGAKLDDELNYMHGTGHGFGSFLNVHERPQSFSSDTVLVPGHVITNEPGYHNAGKWGMRIESALAVRRVKRDTVLPFFSFVHANIPTTILRQHDSHLFELWVRRPNTRLVPCRDSVIQIHTPHVRITERLVQPGFGTPCENVLRKIASML
ncbi:hypothetical protein BD309DRAFT_994978 [Dichomitus squalens]|nr:hypothetical protein BD309DRAFT_994978 [Dichomitus squalens]